MADQSRTVRQAVDRMTAALGGESVVPENSKTVRQAIDKFSAALLLHDSKLTQAADKQEGSKKQK